MIYIHFIEKLWESRINRAIFSICTLLILSFVVLDSLEDGPESAATICFGSLGVGVGAIFLGMNMMRLLPDDPRYHGQWRAQAALLISAGGILLYEVAGPFCWSACLK
jgi:hypothetical protein